ncbi:hypothetical protein QU600_000624 [Orientia tsutsugamushi]
MNYVNQFRKRSTIACMELVREYMSKATQIIRGCASSYNIYNTI